MLCWGAAAPPPPSVINDKLCAWTSRFGAWNHTQTESFRHFPIRVHCGKISINDLFSLSLPILLLFHLLLAWFRCVYFHRCPCEVSSISVATIKNIQTHKHIPRKTDTRERANNSEREWVSEKEQKNRKKIIKMSLCTTSHQEELNGNRQRASQQLWVR